MVLRMSLGLALAMALGEVPSFVVAAEPSSGAAIIALAVGAGAVTLAGIGLLVARRRGSASDAADQARSTEATDQVVSAALTRRMVNRGRLRVDDDVLNGSRPAPAARESKRVRERSD